MASPVSVLRFIAALLLVAISSNTSWATEEVGVAYDSRSLIVNGRRELFFSGSIQYPRSPPEMWPDLIRKAKQGGLNVIQSTCSGTSMNPFRGSFYLEAEDLPMRRDIRPVIQINSLGHMVHAFVNGIYIGSAHGVKLAKKFIFQNAMDLKAGINHLALLFLTVGTDSGAGLEKKYSGIDKVVIQGLNTETPDLTVNGWGHELGIHNEDLAVFNAQRLQVAHRLPGTRYFDAPTGNDPVALDMSSMGKGLVWINGECIGRYLVSYLSPLGQPSQSVYHIPRAFLRLKNNLMVVFEEHGGRPEDISIVTVKRDNICTFVSEFHPAHIKSWVRQDSQIRVIAEDVKPSATLKCPEKKVINQIVFASFGNPMGVCGNFTVGNCHTPQAKILVEKLCLGKRSCTLPVSHQAYGTDLNCPGTTGALAVQAKCSRRNVKANSSK